MNKKKLILILIIIIIVYILRGIIIYDNLFDYSNIIKTNWNIKLPRKSIKEIYSVEDVPNIHGEGISYHIFSYKEANEEEINKLFTWATEEKETIYFSSYSEAINNWIDEFNINPEDYPNYANCKYWYSNKEDNSEIIILWDSKENKLYVVESFL